ncbi:MAG: thioredoxin [Actinomycetota bacterium]
MAIISCSSCGAKNRVEDRGPGVHPVCGRCGTELPAATSKPVELTDSTLAGAIRDAGSRPVVVDCWAAWCGPCRALAPILESLAAESGGQYVVAKLDIDANPRTASQYEVQSIPMLLFFKNGALVDQMVGLQSKAAIQAKLKAHL